MGLMVVTGGAGCIGLAICRRLRDSGSAVAAMDLAAQIKSVDWDADRNRGIRAVEGDVTSRASVQAAAAALGDEPLAGLVNCAGVLRDTFLGRVNDAAMDLMFQVNVAGMARVTDVLAPRLADGSAIVNIGSLTGQIGRFTGASVYGATKAGVAAYTTYLAVELAGRQNPGELRRARRHPGPDEPVDGRRVRRRGGVRGAHDPRPDRGAGGGGRGRRVPALAACLLHHGADDPR